MQSDFSSFLDGIAPDHEPQLAGQFWEVRKGRGWLGWLSHDERFIPELKTELQPETSSVGPESSKTIMNMERRGEIAGETRDDIGVSVHALVPEFS